MEWTIVAALILLALLALVLLRVESVHIDFSGRKRVPVSGGQTRVPEAADSDRAAKAAELGPMSKASRVREIRGKYAHLAMGSEEFAAQKQQEIDLEDRRR